MHNDSIINTNNIHNASINTIIMYMLLILSLCILLILSLCIYYHCKHSVISIKYVINIIIVYMLLMTYT